MAQIRRVPRFLVLSLALGGLFLSSLACSAVPFLKPTATPTATSTPTFTLTPTVTLTPTATLTPTRTITPTVSYLDWPIVFSDSFDDEYGGWFTGKFSDELVSGEISITGGKYVFKVTAKNSVMLWFNADAGILEDFFLSAEVKRTGGTGDTNYGIVFRSSKVDYYYFCINAVTKQYRIDVYYDDDWEGIIGWTRSELIDPEGSNQLAVLVQGTQFTLFINGEEVDTFEDESLKNGRVGLGLAMSKAGDTVNLEFDNFEVTAPKKSR